MYKKCTSPPKYRPSKRVDDRFINGRQLVLSSYQADRNGYGISLTASKPVISYIPGVAFSG